MKQAHKARDCIMYVSKMLFVSMCVVVGCSVENSQGCLDSESLRVREWDKSERKRTERKIDVDAKFKSKSKSKLKLSSYRVEVEEPQVYSS